MVAPALNNQIWLVDMVDFSIKKIDPQWEQVTIRIPLRQILDPEESEFVYLREYQNLLFLADRNSGVLIFDNLGNFLRQIAVTGIVYLHFQGNALYYQVENDDRQLYREDLYSGVQDTIQMPAATRSVWLTENGMWLFTENRAVLVER